MDIFIHKVYEMKKLQASIITKRHNALNICVQSPRLKSVSKIRAQNQRSNNSRAVEKKTNKHKISAISDSTTKLRYFEDNTNISKMVTTMFSRTRLHAHASFTTSSIATKTAGINLLPEKEENTITAVSLN